MTTYPEAHDPRCHSTQTGCLHAIPARATAHAGPGHRSLRYIRRHDRRGHGGPHAVGFGHAVEYRRVPHPSGVHERGSVIEPGGVHEPGSVIEPGGVQEPGSVIEPGGVQEPGSVIEPGGQIALTGGEQPRGLSQFFPLTFGDEPHPHADA